MFISVKDADKDNILPAARKMVELGFKLIATGGTAAHLAAKGLAGREWSTRWRRGGRTSSTGCSTAMSHGLQYDRGLAVAEGQPFHPRHGAGKKVPYFTTASASLAAARSIRRCGTWP